MDEVKKLLEKHNYKIVAHLRDDAIFLNVPERVLEPLMEAYTVKYTIGEGYMTYIADGDDFPYKAACPTYAARCLILMDIKRHCETLDFNTNLIEFFNDSDKIDETEFFTKMWPKELEYSDAIRRLEYNLKDLLIRAKNAAIPFHHDFYFEADQMGVLPGYLAVRSTFVSGEEDSDE